jgi:hypothetical protein
VVIINEIKRGDSPGHSGEEIKMDLTGVSVMWTDALRGYDRRGRGPEGVLDIGRWSVAEMAKPCVNGRRGWGYSARR